MKTGNVKNEVAQSAKKSPVMMLHSNGKIEKASATDAVISFASTPEERQAKRSWFKKDKESKRSKYNVTELMRKYNKGLPLTFDEQNYLRKINKIE
jgi:hypothetical protein